MATVVYRSGARLADLHHSRHAQVIGWEQLRVEGVRDIEGEAGLGPKKEGCPEQWRLL